MSAFVWIASTAEPDAEIFGVFASREALEYEYPGWQENHDDLILERAWHDTLYASRYPLHHYEGGAS